MQPKQNDSRKKFLLWSAAILSSLTILKVIPTKKKKKDSSPDNTVKMLSQEGKLVEIDKRLLTSSARKVSKQELQQWIKK